MNIGPLIHQTNVKDQNNLVQFHFKQFWQLGHSGLIVSEHPNIHKGVQELGRHTTYYIPKICGQRKADEAARWEVYH